MPQVPTPLPADRAQPADRTARLREVGEHTLLSDRQGRFLHVKPVAWARSRAGDDMHWANSVLAASARPAADCKPHPCLAQFAALQAEVDAVRAAGRKSMADTPTSNSVYGSHSYAAVDSAVNKVGAQQVAEQSGKLWGSLQDTSKRLGLAVGATEGDEQLARMERQAERRRFTSTYGCSYGPRPEGARVEIAQPDSMNRTSCLFPLSPVNKHSAQRRSPTRLRPTLGDQEDSKGGSQTGAISSASFPPSSTSTSRPASASPHSAASASASPSLSSSHRSNLAGGGDGDCSTAHSLGYGRRHRFYKHYLTSLPDV